MSIKFLLNLLSNILNNEPYNQCIIVKKQCCLPKNFDYFKLYYLF